MAAISRRLTASIWVTFLIATMIAMVSLGHPATSAVDLAFPFRLADLAASLRSVEILTELARLATIALAGWLLVSTSVCFLLDRLSTNSGHDQRRYSASRTEARSLANKLRLVGRRYVTGALRATQRLTPRFVIAIIASSVVSSGVASASPSGSDHDRAQDRGSPEPPTMELVSPPPDAHTFMPWGTTTGGAPGTTLPSQPLSDSPVLDSTGSDSTGSNSPESDSSGSDSIEPTTTDEAAEPSPVASGPGPRSGPIPNSTDTSRSEPSLPTMELLDPSDPPRRRTEQGTTLGSRAEPTPKAPTLRSEALTPGSPRPDQAGAEVAHHPQSVASIHVVAPGEHLWSIAEDTLRQRLGPSVDLRQIRTYWKDLIEENRDRLADPGNPDFILPGQELKLPT